MKTREERILVLCKTYPSPSAKYSETSCVAGITEPGNLIRLYPVPFRLVNDVQQFKKWQWISARIKRSPDDRRTESYRQGSLFEETDRDLRLLRKLPYDFHFRYQFNTLSGPMQYRHKIVDWEVGALFWNLKRAHGQNWETPFRAKIEQQLPSKDLMFLMGTIHRFPGQWLIVSLFYPPKLQPDAPVQESLFSQ